MEETVKKTGYEWCLEANIRPLNIDREWPYFYKDFKTAEEAYFRDKISAKEFYDVIQKCTVKPNSQPRKTPMYLEYRMYGLVPYNISEIQKGIQFGHAVVRYGRTVKDIKPLETYFNKWADVDQTFIILNGGTTNNNPERLGSLNNHFYNLQYNGIKVQPFYEPDLGDQLSAICFLVDERVFNRTLYPDFVPETLPWSRKKPSEKALSELDARNKKNYEHWVEKIGGPENTFLRDFLKPLKLA